MPWQRILIVMFLLECCAAEAAERPADLVLRGGKVVTMDQPQPSATALAIRGDRILIVGDDVAIRPWIGANTRIIELQGELVIPGLIEGHGHFLSLGQSRQMLDLSQARSWEEIARLVAQAAAKVEPGQWILGRGWHQSKWERPPQPNVEGYPVHDRLSQAAPDHPVLLTHASGHMTLANARAMELAGVDRSATDPPGGTILRDRAGQPIGAFREAATSLVERAYETSRKGRTADQVRKDREAAILRATEECLALGVTSFHDAGESWEAIGHFRELAERGRLGVRLWVMVGEPNDVLARRLPQCRMVGVGNHHLTVRAIKRFIDGALGTHGAWMLEPYSDLPKSSGLNTESLESLAKTAELAIRHDFQLCVHAIGDRANRQTLDLFERTFQRHPGKRDLRWRIEHAQHLNTADMPRFGRLGVIAAMQGIHATSDAPFVVTRLGQRRSREGAYAWRSLLDAGAMVVNGTDTPVEDLNPLRSFYASVTRRLENGATFFPEQRMTRQEALRSYTTSPAYAAFEESLKGSLAPGKLADIVVLSHDILSVPEEQILRTRVLYTVVGGRVLVEKGRILSSAVWTGNASRPLTSVKRGPSGTGVAPPGIP